MYPDKLIRGISDKNHKFEGAISAAIFHFNKMMEAKKSGKQSDREDGWWEESINWYDNDEALTSLLNQKKDDRIQFKGGAVILDRSKIDIIRKLSALDEMYKYERNAIDDNHYHGNLLCHPHVPIEKMKQIAGSIALLCVDKVIDQPT